MNQLGWTSIKTGPIYCSPACGGGCTWAAYETAVASASRLVNCLGEDWEPYVWENLGWHFSADNPSRLLSVHQNNSKTANRDYTAYLNHQFVEHGNTPQAAILDAINLAQPSLKKYKKLVACIEEIENDLL